MTTRKELGGSTGAVIWKGPSEFDGSPLVAIATGIVSKGVSNRKVGDAVQVWILREDMRPSEALRSGDDLAICGDCKFRPAGQNGTDRACYVHIGHATNVWLTYKDDRYHKLPLLDWRPTFRDRVVRLGAYGDPVAMPLNLASFFNFIGVRRMLAYTHAWRRCDQKWRRFAMASVDTPEELRLAQEMGWRTFRTRFPNEPITKTEIPCPASAEAGKRTTCEQCRLCDGLHHDGLWGVPDRRKSISIAAHGSTGFMHRYEKARSPFRILP